MITKFDLENMGAFTDAINAAQEALQMLQARCDDPSQLLTAASMLLGALISGHVMAFGSDPEVLLATSTQTMRLLNGLSSH